MSKVITIGSRKGGVGKTTVTVNLAYLLASYGAKVMVMDTDPQGSVMEWNQTRKEREEDYVQFGVAYHKGNLSPDINQYKGLYDFILIDVAGRDGRELRTAMAVSDILVSPIQPSQVDISTIQHLIDHTFLEIQDINPSLKMLILLNQCSTNIMVKDAHEYDKLLREEYPEVVTMHRKLLSRKAYIDCWCDGRTIFEFEDKRGNKSRDEFIEFTRELFDHLELDYDRFKA